MSDQFGKKTHAQITKDLETHKRKGEPSPPHQSVGRTGSQRVRQRIKKTAEGYPLSNKKSKVVSPPTPRRAPRKQYMRDKLAELGVGYETILGISDKDLPTAFKAAQNNKVIARKEGGKSDKTFSELDYYEALDRIDRGGESTKKDLRVLAYMDRKQDARLKKRAVAKSMRDKPAKEFIGTGPRGAVAPKHILRDEPPTPRRAQEFIGAGPRGAVAPKHILRDRSSSPLVIKSPVGPSKRKPMPQERFPSRAHPRVGIGEGREDKKMWEEILQEIERRRKVSPKKTDVDPSRYKDWRKPRKGGYQKDIKPNTTWEEFKEKHPNAGITRKGFESMKPGRGKQQSRGRTGQIRRKKRLPKPPWMSDPRYKGYFNPKQLNPFFNPNEIEVAGGGYLKPKIKSKKGGGKVEQKAKGGKVMNKKSGSKVLYKRNGGMSRVGLSPAEEARAGVMSEAARRRPRMPTPRPQPPVRPALRPQPPVRTPQLPVGTPQLPVRPIPRPPVPQMAPPRPMNKGGKVGKKKSKGKRISSKQTDGNKVVASLYD